MKLLHQGRADARRPAGAKNSDASASEARVVPGRIERMRADFLANASHELRTPLASLAGFIETLRGHAKDDPKARETFLGIMAAQADRMTRLIADLLSLSRIEMNEHIAPQGRVDLAAALREILNASGPVWAARKVSVDLDAQLEPAFASGDRDQLIQVLQNLIENAVKYTPAGSPIEISARNRREGIELEVADRGPGFTEGEEVRVFEKFYRGASVAANGTGGQPQATPRIIRGAGLGLPICKAIVEAHRGKITACNRTGGGAVFRIVLPTDGVA